MNGGRGRNRGGTASGRAAPTHCSRLECFVALLRRRVDSKDQIRVEVVSKKPASAHGRVWIRPGLPYQSVVRRPTRTEPNFRLPTLLYSGLKNGLQTKDELVGAEPLGALA